MHQCIDHKILPQNKNNCLKKGVCMREILLFENHLCNYFFINHRCRTSKNQMTLDFTSDVQFWWNKIWFGGFLTFWMWCKYLICTSKLQSSPTKYLSYRPNGQIFWKNNANPKKNCRDVDIKIKCTELKWSYQFHKSGLSVVSLQKKVASILTMTQHRQIYSQNSSNRRSECNGEVYFGSRHS